MNGTLISGLAGVFGSLVGGSAAVMIAWITQRTLSRRELIRAEINYRETLYGEYICECTRLLMDSLAHTLDKPETLLTAYALLNRIRLSASNAILLQAELMLIRITEQYTSPNLSMEEMLALTRSPSDDPLKMFGEACRMELKSILTEV